MKSLNRVAITLSLMLALLSSALPCGPGYISPVFDFTNGPEHPYTNFAAGQLGIIKPDFYRSVLFAAYRYLNGGSFSPDEQKAMVEFWKADIDRDYQQTDDVSDAVKAWVERRKDVVGKEEKLPDIYVERTYGGYDFFPNCTRNAFEVATETLADRVASHGPTDQNVLNWVSGQDQVFQNCSSGKRTPDDPPQGASDWLQKDRAYQKAAAEFYSLDYHNAKLHFAEIAQDTESPWQETADYLVARTLIRQASLSRSPETAAPFYDEAEIHLQRFISRTGKFSASAERLNGLIRYRRHPRERVGELARKLAYQTGNDNFKQDLIDYTWLLDKFESEALEAEFKRKQAIEAAKNGVANVNKPDDGRPADSNANTDAGQVGDDKFQITVYSDNYVESWVITVTPETTDDQAIAEAQRVIGKPLTEEMKKRVRESRQSAYASRFSDRQTSAYEGGYYSEDELSLSALPAFLRNDDLTDWLFTFQSVSPEAYLYSLKRFRESGSDLWLMTALSRADKNSSELNRLLEAADRVSRISPGFQTIAYHHARLLLDLGKNTEARTLIDDILNMGDQLPIATRNSFLGLRLRLAETLEDFLRYSLRRPFAFDFSGSVGSIDELIAEQKTYYDPESNKDGKESFDREVEDRFKEERLWQERQMLSSETIDLMNRTFPQSVLLEVEKSPALPEYLRPKFAIAIWTRAFLLDDMATLLKITPELAKYNPDFEPQLARITAATTQSAMDRAVLYFVVKNPVMSPYLEDGMGKTDNEFGQWDSNDWWCSSYLSEDDAEEVGAAQPRLKPAKFLTAAQKQAAAAERKKLIDLGDAPDLLAKRVIVWARSNPGDKRVPEALYIVHEANGWTKYGCGNSEELQEAIAGILRKNYPSSEWTRKLDENKEDQ